MKVLEGDRIPAWEMPSVSAERMQTMAAILRDPNPVHWDRSAVARLGLGMRTINQGPLGGGYMINMLHEWAGENCLRRFRIRFPSPLIFDGDRLIAQGEVSRVFQDAGERFAECEVWLEREGERGLIEGTATVILPHAS